MRKKMDELFSNHFISVINYIWFQKSFYCYNYLYGNSNSP